MICGVPETFRRPSGWQPFFMRAGLLLSKMGLYSEKHFKCYDHPLARASLRSCEFRWICVCDSAFFFGMRLNEAAASLRPSMCSNLRQICVHNRPTTRLRVRASEKGRSEKALRAVFRSLAEVLVCSLAQHLLYLSSKLAGCLKQPRVSAQCWHCFVAMRKCGIDELRVEFGDGIDNGRNEFELP